jgi:hypothetical protein
MARLQTVEKNIYFYRLNGGWNGSIRRAARLDEALGTLRDLPFGPDSRRYWKQEDGDDIAVWLEDNVHPRTDRFAFGRVRRSAFPQVERDGTLSALQLADREGLCEIAHARSFNDEYLGVVFNHYAPRISRLGDYLAEVGVARREVGVEALLRNDALEALQRHREIRLVDLQVRSASIRDIASADPALASTLNAMEALSGAEVVGVTLRPERYGQSWLSPRWFGILERLMGLPNFREAVTKLHVKALNGGTERVEPIDLLQDQLIVRKSVLSIGSNSKAIKPDSAWSAIGEAFDDLRAELRQAPGVAA